MPTPIESRPQFALKPLALAIAMAAGSLISAPRVAAELPTGASIVHGDVTFANPNANTLNVNQASQRAVVDWQKFNISAGNTVNFNQPNATAVALNRISKEGGASMIAGALNANGRVYLVNQNGIVFQGTARVNTAGLLASTLDVDKDQFINSSIFAAINDGKPALSKDLSAMTPDERAAYDAATIKIENGAQIKTASGGSILIFAPNINNEGKLETPDGQTLLAAAKDKVYLTVSDQDDDYRGLVVEVGIGGQVTNAKLGEIIAERGNVTLLGMAVNQEGTIRATTAVDLNGTVRLLARQGAVVVPGSTSEGTTRPTQRGFDGATFAEDGTQIPAENPSSDIKNVAYATEAGTVTLGKDSLIEIAPDTNGKTAPKAQIQNPSKVEIMGKTVTMKEGSKIIAHSGEVNVTATATPDQQFITNDGTETRSDARILMESGSSIDVSGLKDVELDMSSNVLEVELRGNELKDSPLQRDGILRGQTVKVDLRNGDSIPIADISAAVGAIKHSVNERMTTGGTVTFHSTGDVVQNKDATVDISGGYVHYKAGFVDSTKLISDGVVYDISEADPNRIYDGIVGLNTRLYKKWNVLVTYVGMNTRTSGTWVDAYNQGSAAGAFKIDAHQALLEGDILAHVTESPYQRDLASRVSGGTLDLALRRGQTGIQELRIVDDMIYHDVAEGDELVTDSDITANANAVAQAGKTAGKKVLIDNDGDGIGEVLLSDHMLSASGLAKINVNIAGDATFEKNAEVQLADGAKLSLTGTHVDHLGTFTARGGEFDLTGSKAVAVEGSVDVSGRFTNDYAATRTDQQHIAVPTDAITVNGGKVSLNATGDLTLAAGSVINADGGAYISRGGKVQAGKGGDISLVSEVDGGADVTLDGSLSSYALQQGGKLSIAAASVAIGDNPDISAAENGHVLVLDSAFFQHGGFGSYDITANMEALLVDGSADLKLVAQNRLLTSDNYLLESSGTSLAAFTALGEAQPYLRDAVDISLTLAQTAVPLNEAGGQEAPLKGSFVIAKDASIATDVGGHIALKSDNSLFIDGTLHADGGGISATINPHANKIRGYDATQSLWLGEDARLISNAAWVEGESDPKSGLRSGEMFDAGSISLDAQRGFLAIEENARIEASGAQAQYDAIAPVQGNSTIVEQTAVGAAGKVELLAAEGILLDGNIELKRANEFATGGELLIGFSRSKRLGTIDTVTDILKFPQNDMVVQLDANQSSTVGDLKFGDQLTKDDARIDKIALNSNRLNAMDLDVLTLEATNRFTKKTDLSTSDFISGRIEFKNNVVLNTEREINLRSTNLRVEGESLGKVESAVITLGVDTALFDTQYFFPLTRDISGGHGALVFSGNLIDIVGNIAADNVAELSLASRGDIRFRSNASLTGAGFAANALKTSGDINLLAQQIYPTSLSDYSIVSTKEDGHITVARADGNAEVPLSAAGKLSLLADNIDQGGVVRAPLGQIVLGNEDSSQVNLLQDSLTSVSAEGKQIPLGRIEGENLVWGYQTSGGKLVIDKSTLPDKKVVINGDAVDINQGATVDVSGNGDIYATEFITGPGGSIDVLDGANAGNTFALVPTLKNSYAPYDINENRNTDIALGSTLRIAQDVRLANGQVLTAGEYTILPARYALQTGAVLVTPVATKGEILPGQQASRLDGAPVVAGKLGIANTALEDANWSAFAIEPGTVALTRSEYVRKTATEFFTGDKALYEMAGDAGQLQILAGSSLNLDGDLVATHAQGARGSRVDIVADNLLIAQDNNTAQAAEDTVVLNAGDISAFGADSVLLGGSRTRGVAATDDAKTTVTNINVAAQSVTVSEGASLTGSEFLFAAKDNVSVGANAHIATSAENSRSDIEHINIDGDGALLQVSGIQRALVQRTNETGSVGDLTLGAGSVITASKSTVLDASHAMSIEGAAINSDSLTLSAQRIVLGDAQNSADTSGAILTSTMLGGLNPKNFTLFSRSDISIASDITVNAQNLSLQAGNISANGHSATFNAASLLTLEGNSNSTTPTDTTGTLAFNADFIQLGAADDKAVASANLALDAASTTINAGSGLILNDALAIKAAGDVAISAPQISAANAADTVIDAAGQVGINKTGNENPLLMALSALGASLNIVADTVGIDTRIKLPSATVSATTREGDIVLGSNAAIDVAGIKQQFDDQLVASGGGNVTLQANAGSVTAAAGSLIDVSGAALSTSQGSGAGTVDISAATGNIGLAGILKANAVEAGKGGAIDLDAVMLNDLGAIVNTLGAAGFDREVHLRQRQSDIALQSDQTVKALDVSIEADAGNVTVAGKIDASGTKGGEVAINAGKDAVLASTAVIDANATAADGRGGNVAIGSVNGELALETGSSIDVSGGNNAATNQGINSIRQGEVHLRARRSIDDNEVAHIAVREINATVLGADRIELEAFDDSIKTTSIDSDVLNTIKNNIDTFIAKVTTDTIAGLGSLAAKANFYVLPGIEVHSDTDLSVDTPIDFSSWRYTIGDKSAPGVFTLRAAGNLRVNNSISDGLIDDPAEEFIRETYKDFGGDFIYSYAKVHMNDYSWHYNLTAGADTAAASVDTVRNGVGDFILAANTLIRTGTGDIRIAAGNDVEFSSNTSLVYTVGKTPYYRYATPQSEIDNFLLTEPYYDMPYIGYIYPFVLDASGPAAVIPNRIAFPHMGGDIKITAGGDISMKESSQLSSDWISRYAGTESVTGLYINTWGVIATELHTEINMANEETSVGAFQQGIAAMGGGDINIKAGGDITNLSASIPVTMRQNLLADFGNSENPLPITGEIVANDGTYFWERNGGGDLTVVAGGNVLSPNLLADKGTLSVTAGGSIGVAPQANAALLSIADTHVELNARRDINIGEIFNTTMVAQSKLQLSESISETSANGLSVMFTYSDDAQASLFSTAGDIVFDNKIDLTLSDHRSARFPTQNLEMDKLSDLLNIMPGIVKATAMSGDIYIENDMNLFPHANGQLELLAGQNIGTHQTGSFDSIRVAISDVDPTLLPTLLNPAQSFAYKTDIKYFSYDAAFDAGTARTAEDTGSNKHASTPIHEGDLTAAHLVALNGDIDGNSVLAFTSAKKLQAYAGNDIRDVSFDIQNANASDTSELRAGNDIDLGFAISAAGQLVPNWLSIQIAGPGRLDVIAGGDVNLGNSKGVLSIGNSENPALPDYGADVMVMAGAASLDTKAVATAYLSYVGADGGSRFVDLAASDGEQLKALFDNPSKFGITLDESVTATTPEEAKAAFQALGAEQQLKVALALRDADNDTVDNRDYTASLLSFVLSDRFAGDAVTLASEVSGQAFATREQLISYVATQTVKQNNELASAMLAKLPSIDQRGLLFDVVYDEVRKGGLESLKGTVVDSDTQGFQRSYNAIETLFPGIDQNDPNLVSDKGDINLVFSTIATKDGGDVNFMAPQGGIDVGVAASFGGEKKAPANLGLLAQSAGSIHGISYGDININASRVFALDGGDILLWSSQNDIDAGKGAKTALSIPPPKIHYDSNGEPAGIELPLAVSGSGIQAAVYTPKRVPGSVYLYAPQGVIDAGDAGISSAGNLFLAATKVLGADNIHFGGVSIGVPTTTGISASLSGAGDASSASTSAAANDVADSASGNCKGEDCEDNNAVAFVTVEIIGLGD